MINVNQITAQLARMPDQALQQYAQMHKSDPYTVSLALAESNRRKQMRTGAQGQQGAAPQPKVVDQGIAEMAQPMPEDVGIGALPAPNMQGMAEGGIVAFAEGGSPGIRYGGAYGGKNLIPNTTGYEGMGIMDFLQAFGSDVLDRLPSQEKETLKANQARQNAIGEANMSGYKPRSSLGQGERDVLYENKGLMPSAPVAAQAAPLNAPVPDTSRSGGSPFSGTGIGTPRAAAATVAPVAAPQDFLTQLEALRAKRGPAVDPLRADREAITNETVKGQQEGIAALKADQAADMAEMRKGQEGRITKREGELEKSKDTNTGLAFLEAGLAMMQARGPGLAAIAQGAGVGVKQYAAGIDKIKSAQEKLDDARDRMEELRQNQASMNKREIRAEEKDLRKTLVDGKRDLLAGVEKATGVQSAEFVAGVTSNIAVSEAGKQRATALEAARIAAGPGMERNKMMAKQMEGQDKVRKDYITLQTKVMADLSKDPNYALEQDQSKKTAIYNNALRAALQNNPFLSSYAAGIGFNNAPASGTVRTLDED